MLLRSVVSMLMVSLALAGANPAFSAEKKAKKAPTTEAPAAEIQPATPAQPAAKTDVPDAKDIKESDVVPEQPLATEAASRPLLGDVGLGPIITLVNIPHPLSLGIEGKYKDFAGFAVNLGLMPSISIGPVKAELSTWDLRARWFPFSSAMFLGAAFGNQTFDFSSTVTGEITPGVSQSADITMEVSTTFLTPHIGWRWGAQGGKGFFYGMELGWQIALSSKVTGPTSSNAAVPDQADELADVRKAGEDIGQASLPHLTLIQFGWLF
jgi:hypothetical protein